MSVKKMGCRYRFFLPVLLAMLMFIGISGMIMLPAAFAAGGDIKITGPGLNSDGITITQDQLQGKEKLADGTILTQYDEWYSTINTWPTKSWYRGQGAKLTDLLDAAGGLKPEATMIKFTSSDGYSTAFELQEFIYKPHYRFPNFMAGGLQGHLPGDRADAVLVEPMLAHRSFSTHDIEDVGGGNTGGNFSSGDANLLIYGQRAVTQQTNSRFAKNVVQIEILTSPVPKWDRPVAVPEPGEVQVGTMIRLNSLYNDEDKVHYTTDGSDPTILSPMYNWIASRWWSTRGDVLDEINRPVEITGNTVIKALVTGPGRLDSDIATFWYRIPLSIKSDNPARAVKDRAYAGHTFPVAGGTPPYNFAVTEGALPAGMVLDGEALVGIPTESGAFVFTVTVTDSAVPAKTVKRDFTLVVGEEAAAPPALTADTTGNTMGKVIEITFTDDPDWRLAITGIKVNGASVNGKYNIAAGVITIDAGVFDSAGDYEITVLADGYLDATVIQKVAADGGQVPEGAVVLEITGDGVTTAKKYTRAQLEEMVQCQNVYSSINTWPSKRWCVGKGVSLWDLLEAAGMNGSARQVRLFSSDGYYLTLTVQELLRDTRYFFPHFMTGGIEGHIPGDASGAVEVEAILALKSADGTDNPSYMNDSNGLMLMLGQRAVTEQTGPLFVKYVNKVEVSSSTPGKWDKPQADPGGGAVPAGTLVSLTNSNMDLDKIYYTTDGSTPTLNSPMYNWIAKRWWPARGGETVSEINHPIELTKDTTIRAVTIGPGKSNSNIAEFVYKVTETTVSAGDQVAPDQGGTISLGDEVVLEIPAGALTGTVPVSVLIEHVTTPPATPAGRKIISGVYGCNVDGKTNYVFNKAVTIIFKFDPGALSESEIPAVHSYEEDKGRWLNLGGMVSGNTIAVKTDRCAKFAVLVLLQPGTVELITPAIGGMVNLGDEAVLEIPAGALAGAIPLSVTIERVASPPAAPAGCKIISGVYGCAVDGKAGYSFNKPVTITLGFDPGAPKKGANPAIYYYDEAKGRWIILGGMVSGNTIAVQTERCAKFTVMAQEGASLTDIAGHWAEDSIRQLVAKGAVGGYPDSTFKPDINITRAEFVTILGKAFVLAPHGGKIFADTAGHWAQDAVATAVHYGIVNGYDADTFGPDDQITREQMAVMVVNSLQLPPAAEGTSFEDSSDISDWARAAVTTAVKQGLINGYPGNTVLPRNNATRAEAATVMVKAMPKG